MFFKILSLSCLIDHAYHSIPCSPSIPYHFSYPPVIYGISYFNYFFSCHLSSQGKSFLQFLCFYYFDPLIPSTKWIKVRILYLRLNSNFFYYTLVERILIIFVREAELLPINSQKEKKCKRQISRITQITQN